MISIFKKYLAFLAIFLMPTLAYANWQPVQDIGPISPNDLPSAVSVDIDASGNSVALSIVSGSVVASTRAFNGVWVNSPTFPATAGVVSAKVAVDAAGNAIGVWAEAGAIKFSTYDFNLATWSLAQNIEFDPASNSLSPDIKMTKNGEALVVWVKNLGNLGTTFVVRYARSTIFSPWSAPANASPVYANLVSTKLAISENGDGLVSFHRTNFPNGALPKILEATTLPLTGIPSLVTLANALADSAGSVAMDPNGNGVVVWSENATQVKSAVYRNGWFLLGNVPGATFSAEPDVALDDEGNAVAVWAKTTVSEINGARLPFNSGVWQPTSILAAPVGGLSHPKIDIDGVGNAVAVWQKTLAPNNVLASTLPAGSLTWGPIVELFTAVAPLEVQGFTESIHINDAGNAIAAWNYRDPGVSSTYQSAANNIPSTETSTIVASPTVVLTDGIGSEITVTVLDGNGVPIVGNNIILTQNGAATIAPAASGITNANGQVIYTVTDATAQTVTFTATDQQTSIVIGTVNVTFIDETDPAMSTISANPLEVEANGVDFSTVTVTLRDSGGNLLSGHTVELIGNPNTSVITPATAVTVAGVAQFQVRSTNLGPVDYTARDITIPLNPITVDGFVTVTFIPVTTSPGNSTVVAVPTSVQADGVASSTITVTLRNANNNPVVGHTVQLTQNVGGNSVITTVNAVTNANGEAIFTVTDLVVEDVTYTATDLTNGPVVVTQKAVVSFTDLIPDPTKSTISAAPPAVPADGVAFSTVTVTLLNANDVPISGHDVMLGQGAGSSSITPLIGTTNSNGQVFFTVRDLQSEIVTYTATDITAGIEITGTAQVEFLERVTDAAVSTVNANPTSVFADGVSFSTITVRLKNINGAPIVGHNVSLVADGGSSIISPPSGPSDASGIVTFTVTDTAVESVTYTATDLTDGVVIDQTATVNFTPPPPLPPSNFEGIRVVNKFASQKEFTDILTWTPSPGTNVVSYRIYVNGVLERTIPALGPYRAEFKHRCDNLTYVYRLVAVSDQGVESSPLFVTLPKP